MRALGKMIANRALCMLYGRLIWVLLQMKVFRVYEMTIYGVSEKEVSELSAFKQMDEYKDEFKKAIKSGIAEVWHDLISFLFGLIQDFAIKKKRKKKEAPLYNANFKAVMQ
jgi:O-antigen/teichoic acid export membrane protein